MVVKGLTFTSCIYVLTAFLVLKITSLAFYYFNVQHNSELTLATMFMNWVFLAHECNCYMKSYNFSSYILILMTCMARAFSKPGYTSCWAGFSLSNVLLVSPSFLFSLLHKGMLTVASCMCGLSNLYSESVKKLRTSYISKSSHGNKIFLNIWTWFFLLAVYSPQIFFVIPL